MLLDRQVRRAAYRSGQFTIDETSSQARGLVGWWPLTSNLRDYSGTGQHATANGNPTRSIADMGHWGPSPVWDLDGTADSITIGDHDSYDQTDSLTVSCWFRYRMATPANRAWWVVTKGNSPNLYEWNMFVDRYGGGPTVRTTIWNGTSVNLQAETTTVLSANTAYHQVFVFDRWNENLFVYHNGVQEASDTTPSSSAYTNRTSQVMIGDRQDASEFEIDALMGDVRIYRRVMSDAEVMDLYLNPESLVRPTQRYRLLVPEQAAAPAADEPAITFGSVF